MLHILSDLGWLFDSSVFFAPEKPPLLFALSSSGG
jgi:hypothetical protein